VKKTALILGVAVLAIAAFAGWQIASCRVANIELQADMKDLAAQNGTRIGLNPPSTDEDLRNIVANKAKDLGIPLEPEQVTVQRTGSPPTQFVYLATEYDARVNLFGFSYTLHFSAASPQPPR
jgi:hypothetical protein